VSEQAVTNYLVIGQVTRPHGVRGEVRASIITELPERFHWLENVFISRQADDPAPRPVPVESARLHQGHVLLKLGGINNRNDAESIRTCWLLVPEAEALPLEEGEFYLYQLAGLAVYTDGGEYLGEILEIIETKANNVFVVNGPAGELLLPDIDDVVLDIDLANGRITVQLLDGLRPA
jgi:16S rRNA processing protein RimM